MLLKALLKHKGTNIMSEEYRMAKAINSVKILSVKSMTEVIRVSNVCEVNLKRLLELIPKDIKIN